jgi:hypothetical protein
LLVLPAGHILRLRQTRKAAEQDQEGISAKDSRREAPEREDFRG